MSKDEKLYDVRVVDRYIKQDMLSEKDYESYIKKLPDVEDKSEILIIDEEEIEEETAEAENEALEAESEEGTEIE